MDEVGSIAEPANDPNLLWIPPRYFVASGSMFAYFVLRQALDGGGIDWVGESQLAGSPPIPEWGIPDAQYPSVSMVNWTTGEPNARFWTLVLLRQHFAPNDQISLSNSSDPSRIFTVVSKRATQSEAGDGADAWAYRRFLINLRNEPVCISFDHAEARIAFIIDEANGDKPARCQVLASQGGLTLAPLAWAVILKATSCPTV